MHGVAVGALYVAGEPAIRPRRISRREQARALFGQRAFEDFAQAVVDAARLFGDHQDAAGMAFGFRIAEQTRQITEFVIGIERVRAICGRLRCA